MRRVVAAGRLGPARSMADIVTLEVRAESGERILDVQVRESSAAIELAGGTVRNHMLDRAFRELAGAMPRSVEQQGNPRAVLSEKGIGDV